MNKEEFLGALQDRLSILPEAEIKKHVSYYREMIEDHVEDGYTEEKVIETLGSVDDILTVILEEIALTQLLKERIKPKHSPKKWKILFWTCGFPIWLPLACVAFSLVLVLYILLWTSILVLWCLELTLAVVGLVAPLAAILQILDQSNGWPLLVASILCVGFAVALFFLCIPATKGIARLSKKIWLGIKFLIIGKEKRK